MAFSKAFPERTDKSNYPRWIEILLTDEEEGEIEEKARKENIALMKQCLEDAENILKEKNMKDFQTNIVQIAISLFEKRASHIVYHKERKAKEKFDSR